MSSHIDLSRVSAAIQCLSLRAAFAVPAIAAWLAAFAGPAALTQAQTTNFWINSGGGAWHDPFNWSESVPGPTDQTVFNQPGSFMVTWDEDSSAGALEFLGGTIGFQAIGAARTHAMNGSFGINGGPSAQLTIGSTTAPALVLAAASHGGHVWNGSGVTVTGSSELRLGGAFDLGSFNVTSHASRLDLVSGGRAHFAQSLGIGGSPVGDSRLTVSGTGSRLEVGNSVQVLDRGMLAVLNGATAEVGSHLLVYGGTATSTVSVNGAQSRLTTSGDLRVGDIASNGRGAFFVFDGATALTNRAELASRLSFASVLGPGSAWTVANDLIVGLGDSTSAGNCFLEVVDGGLLQSGTAVVGSGMQSGGKIGVGGTGSRWTNTGDLSIGALGSGEVIIFEGGRVVSGGTLAIGDRGIVSLYSGGRFEFGITDRTSFSRIEAAAGTSLRGVVNFTGDNDLNAAFPGVAADISEVQISNYGTLRGSGSFAFGLINQAAGHLRASSSDWIRLGGPVNLNAGRISNFGGVVEFGGSMANAVTGLVAGRGVFIAGGGFVNAGNFAVSGTTDIVGDFNNLAGGRFVTSANATSTFYDDVVNNGEIRTSLNGHTVFFGGLSGSGSFTGTGNVFIEGDMSPGNSPGVSYYGGNLFLGSGSNTLFELGGEGFGDYDKLVIDGNLSILGSMSVELWGMFQLGGGMNFLVAEVGGTRTGMFQGLGEGALVGNFGGHDLFITYAGGDGNDIGLFTAIPEPSILFPAAFTLACATGWRRRIRCDGRV